MNKLCKNTILTIAGASALVGVGQMPLPNVQVADEYKLVASVDKIYGYADIENEKVMYAYKTDEIVLPLEGEVIEKRKENEITILNGKKLKTVRGNKTPVDEYSTLLLGYPQFTQENGVWIDLDYSETTKEAYEKQTGPQKVIDLILGSILPNVYATTTTYITSGTSWAGATTDGSNIIVECIGGGGDGGAGNGLSVGGGGGGGGGEYAKKSVAYTSGSTVNNIQIGTGNAEPDHDTFWNTNVVYANGGNGGEKYSGGSPGAGGTGGTGGTGDTKYNGGTGGAGSNGTSNGGGGGGGAGGLNANGVNGVNSGTGTGNGGDGGHGDGTYGGDGGAGGTSGDNATVGSAGQEYDTTHGSGGGGGGGKAGYSGKNGGLYGAGGGGAGEGTTSGGAGKQGLIVVTYTEASGPVNLKTWDDLVKASVKTINGLVITSVKSVNGLE